MSVSLGYPGVYIQEMDAGVRTITGVATSITAFIGRASRGKVKEPVTVRNFSDYERRFGGLSAESMMGYAVRQFFVNGGSEALIVRLHHEEGGDGLSRVTLPAADGPALSLVAENPGEWADELRAMVDHDTRDEDDTSLFNLRIEERNRGSRLTVLQFEEHRNVSVEPDSPRYIAEVLKNDSALVRIDRAAAAPTERPIPTVLSQDPADFVMFENGNDGRHLDDADITDDGFEALDDADIFNLLCIPPYGEDENVPANTWSEAAAYCEKRRAILLVDPPTGWNEPAHVTPANVMGHVLNRSENSALYFPRIVAADPLKENRPRVFVPSGAVAGIIARTDANRGIWKSPAGQEATLVGVSELDVKMTDEEQGPINRTGVNGLRTFSVAGRVVWGARTLRGADSLADQWKYLSVRRLALYIQESLYRGTQWVVFEGNDEPLWSQIRLSLGTFMHDLFRQGAFQGTTPRDAYFVKCDSETTTQSDIDRGIVNIIVGFAPLKPAEFVVIYIQQIAQQVEV
jgi:uncharacterized protein